MQLCAHLNATMFIIRISLTSIPTLAPYCPRSDVVVMAAYAPLLVSVSDVAWTPNAIVFNSTASYGIPSYWVQVLFANHTGAGSLLLPYNATVTAPPTRGGTDPSSSGNSSGKGGLDGDLLSRFDVPVINAVPNASFSITRSADDGAVVIKAVNYGGVARNLSLSVLSGGERGQASAQPAKGTLYTITGAGLMDENSFAAPQAIAPVATRVATGPGDTVTLPPWSINVLRLDGARR